MRMLYNRKPPSDGAESSGLNPAIDHSMKTNRLTRLLLPTLFLFASAAAQASDLASQGRQLVQLLDYIAVDYRDAVADGQIISEAEYSEMQEFSATALSRIGEMTPPLDAAPARQAAELARQIEQYADPDTVADLAQGLREQLIRQLDLVVVPAKAPNIANGAALYAANCTACHGEQADGAGALAVGMEPAPTDFTDVARYRHRSAYGLYSTITQGVDGTSMPAFAQFSDAERWDLAFFVGSLAAEAPSSEVQPQPQQLAALLSATPAEWAAREGASSEQMQLLRTQPQVYFSTKAQPLQIARELTEAALIAARAEDYDGAYRQSLSAYLDGFELIENGLATVDSALMQENEAALLNLRGLLKRRAPLEEINTEGERVLALLDRAEAALDGGSLTGWAAFTASFIILLREGLEAILVVAALLAFLRKTQQPAGIPYLHAGWVAALISGIGLWWLSARYLNISGALREQTEGIAALVAAAVMFYLGFWMHHHSQSAQWQQFIGQRVNALMSRGRLWGLAGLSFIAVFRECFETALFYQALWAQTDAQGHQMTIYGIGAAAAVLAVLAVLILRMSTRLPLRQFFSWTGVFLFVLAVIFAGKGIIALQEAGVVPLLTVPGPRIDLLGVYPSAVSLGVQLLMVVVGIVLLRRTRTGAAA